MSKCLFCRAEMDPNAETCPGCGKPRPAGLPDSALDPIGPARAGAGTTPAPRCPGCGGMMRNGFLALKKIGYGGIIPVAWNSGAPKGSFWDGYSVREGDEVHPVTTFRCDQCGRLELYANN